MNMLWISMIVILMMYTFGPGSIQAKEKSPVKSFQYMESKTIEALNFDDFSNATASMVAQYQEKVVEDDTSSTYASGRLIVKTNGELPDLSAYNVAMMIRDEEGHYLIQFDRASNARRCAEYLMTIKEIEYVEPDGFVMANLD